MELKEAFILIGLVMLLQATLGAILYFLSPTALNLEVVAVAILTMTGVAGVISTILIFASRRYARERALRVMLMTLSEDERKVFEAIMHAGGEARQDKLRRELNISKAKLSALVNNLERKRAITKERYWKTNILRVSKEFRG